MTESSFPDKSTALTRVRAALNSCPKCGLAVDEIAANSHKTSDDLGMVRFYFQFIHGKGECIDFTYAKDFESWLEQAEKGKES